MAEVGCRRAVVVASGEFGHDVAACMRSLLSECGYSVVTASEPVAGVLMGAQLLVRAAWRDVQSEFRAFAIAAAAAHAPWLEVAYAHPLVRVGPVFAGGRPPCPECYLRRRWQHRRDPVDEEVGHVLAGLTSLGVGGYPPGAALIAAGQALALLGAAAAGRAAPRFGHVVVLDCETDDVSCMRVHAAPGCRACEPDSALRARRTASRERLRRLARREPHGS